MKLCWLDLKYSRLCTYTVVSAWTLASYASRWFHSQIFPPLSGNRGEGWEKRQQTSGRAPSRQTTWTQQRQGTAETLEKYGGPRRSLLTVRSRRSFGRPVPPAGARTRRPQRRPGYPSVGSKRGGPEGGRRWLSRQERIIPKEGWLLLLVGQEQQIRKLEQLDCTMKQDNLS